MLTTAPMPIFQPTDCKRRSMAAGRRAMRWMMPSARSVASPIAQARSQDRPITMSSGRCAHRPVHRSHSASPANSTTRPTASSICRHGISILPLVASCHGIASARTRRVRRATTRTPMSPTIRRPGSIRVTIIHSRLDRLGCATQWIRTSAT